MKKIYSMAIAIILSSSMYAQVPEKMSYQAVIRNADNNLVTSQPVGMQISVLQGSISGTAVYVETQLPNTNINGLVSLEIGTGIAVSGEFANIDWSNGPYFMKTETDPTGGTNYTIIGTSQLLSVPYALHAKTAESVTGNTKEKFYLGQDTLGGIVYYIYKNSMGEQHGLIVSKVESIEAWQTTATLTNANRTDDGLYNTALMTNSPAANYVTSLGEGWYLPSIDELCLLYYNRFTTNKALRAGGFTLLSNLASYFSSTELNASQVAYFYSYSASSSAGYKGAPSEVRAIRAF
jgi:hypothetical protein